MSLLLTSALFSCKELVLEASQIRMFVLLKGFHVI